MGAAHIKIICFDIIGTRSFSVLILIWKSPFKRTLLFSQIGQGENVIWKEKKEGLSAKPKSLYIGPAE